MKKIEKKLIIYILLALASLCVALLLVKPAYEELKQKEIKINNLKSYNNLISSSSSKIDSYFNKLEEGQWSKKKIIIENNFNSTPFYEAMIYVFLRSLAFDNGLIISNINSSALAEISKSRESYASLVKGPLKKTTFDITFEGRYASLKSFIRSIENNARIGAIKSISIHPSSSQEAENNLLNFNVSIDFYSY